MWWMNELLCIRYVIRTANYDILALSQFELRSEYQFFKIIVNDIKFNYITVGRLPRIFLK